VVSTFSQTVRPSLCACKTVLIFLCCSVPRCRGLPLYVNECDKQQNVFQTYVGYEELKKTYIKYDPTRWALQFRFSVTVSQGWIDLMWNIRMARSGSNFV
jgi:hypothetical protein